MSTRFNCLAGLSVSLCLALTACGGGGGGGGGGGEGGGSVGSSGGAGGQAGGGTGATAVVPPPAGALAAGVEPCNIPDFPAQALAAVNAVRARGAVCRGTSYGPVAPLGWDNRLAQAASSQAADMASHDRMEHVDSAGRGLGTRVTATGYRWNSVAENLAGGPGTLDGAIQGWLGSQAGHCEALVSSSVTQMGLACFRRPGTRYTNYWALVMARPAN